MTINNTFSRATLAGAVAIALGLGVSGSANATNGLFSHAYGTIQGGLAGAGVALPQDALIASINPAGMAYVGKSGTAGIALFSPMREYTVTGGGPPVPGAFPPFAGATVESGSEGFLIPYLGYNWPLNDKGSVGISVYGNGGMNTNYGKGSTPFSLGTFGSMGTTGINYSQLFISGTYAHKVTDGVSLGISGILNYSMIELKGLSPFAPFSVDPTKISNNGTDSDTGFGVKVGIQANVTDSVALGASYQSEIANTFKDYAGLFPKGGELNIPATATIGIAWKTSKKSTLVFDIQQIFYSDTDAIGNSSTTLTTGCIPSAPFSPLPIATGANCLGGSSGAGFGWDDMTVFKLGYQWEAGDYTWRVGASTGNQPVQEKDVTLNILAPAVVEEHFTFGFSKKLKKPGRAVHAAFMYAPENCVTGPDLFTPGKTVEICMNQFQIEGGYSW